MTNTTFIYHVVSMDSWNVQATESEYTHPSLQAEGFIHCSKKHQLPGVLDRYYKGQKDLLILTIDPDRLESECIYEKSTGGEEYPHIYGPINKSAIVEIGVV